MRCDAEVARAQSLGAVRFSRGRRRTERIGPVAWEEPFELDRAPERGIEELLVVVVMYVM
jgi:hypothetical protein